MLYDASGQAIYLFDAESSTRPECYGECADAWPPVLTTGKPRATGSVQSDLVGTTRRKDGRTQVTYAGHPLYFYAHEGKYQVLCHNIEEYGGTWLVVQPDGEPTGAALESATTRTTVIVRWLNLSGAAVRGGEGRLSVSGGKVGVHVGVGRRSSSRR